MERSWIIPVVITVLVLAILACCACLALGIGFYFITGYNPAINLDQPSQPTPANEVVRVDEEVSTETVEALADTIVPVNDPVALAQRLEGKGEIPATLPPPDETLSVGERQSFWVMNTDDNQFFEVDASLEYITDHLYFWIEDGVDFDHADLAALSDTFEEKIYPTNREFFGSEWSPGIDGDPHLYVLYARGLGGSVAGYFSSGDSYHPDAVEFSNGHEMFLLSAELIGLEEDFTYGVLAHEFQHMIHWYRDRNEESWVNEGFSELAAFLNGYDVGGHDYSYLMDTDVQLNDWSPQPNENGPHYGASFLFMAYFLDRFGEEATKALVAEPENGMVSLDQVLTDLNLTDPETGEPLTAEDVFSDWVLANYIKDGSVGDGRYTYSNYPAGGTADTTERIHTCPSGENRRDVGQYAVDYIQIDCTGSYTLHFEGSMSANLVPADPYSGNYALWSNKGDESHMTLTREFDFTGVSGPLTLAYQTWYDLEEDYDYLYLTASLDGETWQILTTPSGTDEDPSGNSYGWGYNGASGGSRKPKWIKEEVDISQFAGQKVRFRFEYITDAAVNGEGLLLDDIAVPEIDYFSDLEADYGGWEADGFVRMTNRLPQTYRLAVIKKGAETTVETYSLSGDNTLDIPIEIGGDVDEVILVVSGTTRFTRQKTAYSITIMP